jgi:membrane protein
MGVRYNERQLMVSDAGRLRRTVLLAWRATWRGVVEFYNSNNPTYSASIAYYALLSFSPFILIVVSILSRIAVGRAGNDRAAVDLIARALPSNFDFLSAQVVQLQSAPVPLTIAGTLVTLWASMGVFGAVTAAVDHAWGVETPRTYLRHQLTAFLMMLTAGGVFGVSLLVMGAVHVSNTNGYHVVQGWFPSLIGLTSIAAQYSLTPAVIVAMGLLYRYAPNTRVRFRDVWFGAFLAGVLWRIALAGFSWYLSDVSRFSIHGSVGTVVAFLVWVYLSAVILLYGVEVTACYARARADLEKADVA